MKVIIVKDEWYPVYSIDKYIHEWNRKNAIEIDDALWDRYNNCMAEFMAIQNILQELE